MKILLNSKDASVFIGSTELCQKIKEKVLSELFDYEYETNSLISIYSRSLIKEEYNLIDRLELINLIISQKLKELKKKEEFDKINEIRKIKEHKRLDHFSKRQINSNFI